MINYYKTYRKKFEWKHQAQEFVSKLKKKAKIAKLNIGVKILPEYKLISTTKWNESKIVAHHVEWWYKPPRNVK